MTGLGVPPLASLIRAGTPNTVILTIENKKIQPQINRMNADKPSGNSVFICVFNLRPSCSSAVKNSQDRIGRGRPDNGPERDAPATFSQILMRGSTTACRNLFARSIKRGTGAATRSPCAISRSASSIAKAWRGSVLPPDSTGELPPPTAAPSFPTAETPISTAEPADATARPSKSTVFKSNSTAEPPTSTAKHDFPAARTPDSTAMPYFSMVLHSSPTAEP